MTRILVGVTGGKFHGKDTFANYVRSADDGFQINHFAWPLKEMCAFVFNLHMDLFTDPNLKEKTFDVPIPIDRYLKKLSKYTDLTFEDRGLVANTPRELLQCVGTNYVRAADSTYWITQGERLIKNTPKLIIPDVRFPNEEDRIRSNGGWVIRIFRIDMPASGDGHDSETEMDSIRANVTLGVKTGDLSISERVAKLVPLNRLELLKVYDYGYVMTAIGLHLSGMSEKECARHLGVSTVDPDAFSFLLNYYGKTH